jgi:hypothetical protein
MIIGLKSLATDQSGTSNSFVILWGRAVAIDGKDVRVVDRWHGYAGQTVSFRGHQFRLQIGLRWGLEYEPFRVLNGFQPNVRFIGMSGIFRLLYAPG